MPKNKPSTSVFFDNHHQRLAEWKSLHHMAQDWVQLEGNRGAPIQQLTEQLNTVQSMDIFWAFPGKHAMKKLGQVLTEKQSLSFAELVAQIYHALDTESYREQVYTPYAQPFYEQITPKLPESLQNHPKKPYFEVLIVRKVDETVQDIFTDQLLNCRHESDEFVYDVVYVSTIKDAIGTILTNTNILACMIYNEFESDGGHEAWKINPDYLPPLEGEDPTALQLGKQIKKLRQSIDIYWVSDIQPSQLQVTIKGIFNKIIYHEDLYLDVHTTLLNGIRNRYSTPFFHAIQSYSRTPKGVFHALPISQGNSLKQSHWISDMLEFYGEQIFMAETSSTVGGMDSLLDPKGPIKQAQNKVADLFGSDHSYFVTNGTSTSNKIVTQSLLQPGDIVFISSDCHKSIPYSVMLTGAIPLFLPTYPISNYSLYGAVPLKTIKRQLLQCRDHSLLDKVKMVILTNSTFDGIIYDTTHYMMEILAIKPDMVFHWDEAWFSFSYFNPIYQNRTAMSGKATIEKRLQSSAYRNEYSTWKTEFEKKDLSNPSTWTDTPLLPDPDKVVLRVYSTQSTHKTLTSFRQGSMIHVADQQYQYDIFLEAYYTHTSTSPNYQIIASLDISRRQVDLEGYELIKRTLYLAQMLRQHIQDSDLLSQYFKVLDNEHFITPYSDNKKPIRSSEPYHQYPSAWKSHELVVDPTRVSLEISQTGLDGKNMQQLLMNRYDIQVNKVTRNTALFIVNIGSTKDTVLYLIKVLMQIAESLEDEKSRQSQSEKEQFSNRVAELATPNPYLPYERQFHPKFIPNNLPPSLGLGDMRQAYFLAYTTAHIQYQPLTHDLVESVRNGAQWVSASFVTPYPPGFPILVPGQIVTTDCLNFLIDLNIKEIHGLNFQDGLKVFNPTTLEAL